ncbi:MAG: DUF1344 domain-containing protein [Rhodomicrobiaceae bacterium]
MFRRGVIPFILAGALALSGAAFAADKATGDIKTLDPAKRALTLADGKSFKVAKAVDLTKFKVGQSVNVTYEKTKKGNLRASEVSATQ